MSASNLTAALAAFVTVASFGLAHPAGATGPATVDDLHAAGCVPLTWPQSGTNTITYAGSGQAACAGIKATVTYDATPGVDDAVELGDVFDLGSGAYQVDPDLWCGQVDLWLGDVTGVINTPTWSPAYRLLTVRFPGECSLTPVTVVHTPTPQPPPTFPAPTVPSTVDVPLDPTPSTSTTVVPPTTWTFETTPAPTTPAPELPVTGRDSGILALVGAALISAGTALVLATRRRSVR